MRKSRKSPRIKPRECDGYQKGQQLYVRAGHAGTVVPVGFICRNTWCKHSESCPRLLRPGPSVTWEGGRQLMSLADLVRNVMAAGDQN